MTTRDETHLKLLRMIERRPEATQRELAHALGVSLGKLHYCLSALSEKGWVKVRNFRANPDKVAYARILTPAGIEAKAVLTLQFLKRKMAEYEALRAEITALQKDVEALTSTESTLRADS